MKNPPNSSEQALEDYFKDLLLNEPVSIKGVETAPVKVASEDVPPLRTTPARLTQVPLTQTPPMPLPARRAIDNTAVTNLAPLTPSSSSSSSVAALPLRAYAEPIKTLNLRMPLPALAPEPHTAPEIVVQFAAPVAKATPAIEEQHQPPPVVIEADLAESETESPSISAPADWLENGRPAWAQQPFECLLFKVGGLSLAAPLAELGSIYPLDMESLTAIFGQASWFMGLLPVKGYNVRAIDAAQVVMPERYVAEMRAQYRYVITLHGSDWGLAVDSVADSIVLQPDDVRWRGQRSKRPWLAGTLVTQMCALLDVAQLVWMFQNQDGKRITPAH